MDLTGCYYVKSQMTALDILTDVDNRVKAIYIIISSYRCMTVVNHSVKDVR